jgi:hypothetical protein
MKYSTPVLALIATIRSGDPAAIAPEVYGLHTLLQKENAATVIELTGLKPESMNVEVDSIVIDCRPLKDETFGAWMARANWSYMYDGSAITNAYTAIGYDWVDWKWLPMGQSPLTLAPLS